ncbi:hypothetical protein BVL41_08130 [Corynebacterium diphtheriae]|nr:hypothetical protein BVL41_08130 [Corynebacterium diphtheriae]
MTVGRSSSLRMTWSRNTLGCPHVGHSLMGSASMTMTFPLGCTVGYWLWGGWFRHPYSYKAKDPSILCHARTLGELINAL